LLDSPRARARIESECGHTREPDMDEQLKSKLVTLADANRKAMDGTTGPIKRIFEENHIVIGVWQDPDNANGVGFLVLKGGKLLHDVRTTGKSRPTRTSAIPCSCYEQAVAAKKVFGEPDQP
jgi:hypothetical protein